MSHKCPRNGCTTTVSDDDKLMCPQDWHLVPKPIRAAVWRAWDNGDGEGTSAHQAAIKTAIRSVNGREKQ